MYFPHSSDFGKKQITKNNEYIHHSKLKTLKDLKTY